MAEMLRWRRGLFACFLLIGFIMASWIVRTPSVRDALGASTAQMGWVLFGFSLGSMSGILRAPGLVRRFSAKQCITGGLGTAMLGLLILACSALSASLWLAALGLAMVGLGMAVSDVAVNIVGAHVEQVLSRNVLTTIHGCFSLGTAVGSVCGLGLVALAVPVQVHMVLAVLLMSPLFIYVVQATRGARGSSETHSRDGQGFYAVLKTDPKLLLIGLIVLAVALSEGAANDWLPLLIVDSHGVAEQFGSLAFVAFAMTMTVGRFYGDSLLQRFGAVTVIRAGGVVGACGILLMILAPNVWVACSAVVLWASGAALGFPVAMSAGAGNGANPAARISVLATLGYTAFLVGPPLLGFVGEHIGLRLAMLIVLALQLFPVLFASQLAPKSSISSLTPSGQMD